MGAKASALGVLGVAAAVSVAPAATPSNDPEPVVEERVRVHRVQLDVTVAGLPESVADLGVDDFEVVVGGRPIEQLTADAFCDPGPREGEAKDEGPESISARPMVALIYFDQSQLTAEGRLRSLQTARDLVPSLVAGGNRVVIASNAREELVTYTPLTSDADVLLEALDRLAVDALQQDFAPDLEASQVAALESAADSTLQEGRFTERSLYTEKPSTSLMDQMEHAASDERMFAETLSGDLMGMAQAFKADEIDRTDRSLRRFRLALDKLAAEEPPRIALYFGDTLRSNAGQHYLTLLDASQAAKATTSRAGLEPSRSRHGDIAFTEGRFDQLVDHAAGLGIRVYSVEGQGMTGASIRVRDAQGTFRSLGLETGGQAFLNGAEAPTIASAPA